MSDLLEIFAGGARFDVVEIIAAGDDFVAAMYTAPGAASIRANDSSCAGARSPGFEMDRRLRTVAHASRDTVLEVLESHLRA